MNSASWLMLPSGFDAKSSSTRSPTPPRLIMSSVLKLWMHRRVLVLPCDHDFPGIKHSLAALQILQAAVACGEQLQPQRIKPPFAVVCNIPAEPAFPYRRRGITAHLLGRLIGKGRQDLSKFPVEPIGGFEDFINFGSLHVYVSNRIGAV